MTTKKQPKKQPMWLEYRVEMQMKGPFAASIPRDPDDIRAMLESRAPSDAQIEKRRAAGEEITPVPELAAQVAEQVEPVVEGEEGEEVETDEEGTKPGWATFKRDDKGLYYEGRCVRGHIKDCASQLQTLLKIPALKSKVANRVYVETDVIRLYKNQEVVEEEEGFTTHEEAVRASVQEREMVKNQEAVEQRFVHAMTQRGPRSSIKLIDYVECPALSCTLKVLNDGVITKDTLDAIFEYGGVHGMGQERSQGWGKYSFTLALQDTEAEK